MCGRIREKGDLVGVGVQRSVFHAAEIGLGKEKIVAENYRAEAVQRSGKLLVRIIGRGHLADLLDHFWIDALALLGALLEVRGKVAHGSRALVGFAEGDIE